MKRPGIVRECEHPGRPHRHGYQCYRFDRCRCAAGRAYHAEQAAQRRKMKALGLPTSPLVDVLGSKRRLEALMRLGYTAAELSREAGLSRYAIHDVIETNRTIHRDKAAKIAALYDRLWDKPAPDSRGARYVRNLARKRGWLPPLAWDEETIDDPEALPSLLALDPDELPFSVRLQLADELVGLGFSQRESCKRAGIADKTYRRKMKGAA